MEMISARRLGARSRDNASANSFSSDGLRAGTGSQRRAAGRHANSFATACSGPPPLRRDRSLRAPRLSPWMANGTAERGLRFEGKEACDEFPKGLPSARP